MTDTISKERQKAISLAKSFGWTAERKSKSSWEFKQPDTGGLWSVFRIPHSALSVAVVLRHISNDDQQFVEKRDAVLLDLMHDWLREERPGTFDRWIK